MDVRCERCQTEYELEDSSVSETGTEVQCTECGHTFQVHKGLPGGMAASHSGEMTASPATAEWLLETPDGQFHRFRNLTSLQKWIIERKITREDKISRTGHAWRRLGEIVELSPFFDIVDQADRAQALQAASLSLKTEAEQARRAANRTPKSLPVEAGSLDSALRPRLPQPAPPQAVAQNRMDHLDQIDPSLFTERTRETLVVRRRTIPPALKTVAAMGIASVVAYVGITRFWARTAEVAPLTAPTPEPLPMKPASPPVPATAPVVMPTATEAPGTDVETHHAPGALPGPPASPPAADPALDSQPGGRPRLVTEEEQAPSYEKLIAEADKLLERGSTPRAEKLYDRALKQHPEGVEALSGVAYVLLDRGRLPQSIAQFKRVIALRAYGPALFGLAEAYRTAGDSAAALEQYRRYLATEPSGADASAALRQIRVLEAKAAVVAPASDPASPPPSPSSVLQEAAKP